MKKIAVYALLLLGFILLFPLAVSADVILPNTHAVERSIVFVNLGEYPTIVLFGNVTSPVGNHVETFQVENNKPLYKGYKFNKLLIYWNTIEKVDLGSRLNFDNFVAEIQSESYYVDDINPLMREEIQDSIAGFNGGKLVVYESKQ
ncbi:MAG: hypothetical protein PHE50_02425, partial [Dehalococcoidales bacterium]|nr:hypothetical protein [Dehalococcoidales bacterium]